MNRGQQAIRLYFEKSGIGEPMVLLHGFPFDHSIWNPLKPLLKSKTQLILPDLRGLGKSPVSEGISSMEVMAADVKMMLDELEIDKVILAGHSMGGYVSMAFARAYPERLKGLGLVATHAAPDSPEIRKGRIATAAEVEQHGMKALAENMPHRLFHQRSKAESVREIILRMNPKGVSAVMLGMAQRSDSSDVLSQLQIPAAVIAGKEDKIVSIRTAQNLVQNMKKAKLFLMEDSGHMPMFEAPLQTAEALDWLMYQVYGDSGN